MKEMIGFSQEDIAHALEFYVQNKFKWGAAMVSFEFTQSQDKGGAVTRVAATLERRPEASGVDPY